MGLFSEKFEKEERAFVKEVTEKGVPWEEIAIIRERYGREFYDLQSFEKFKNEIISKYEQDLQSC